MANIYSGLVVEILKNMIQEYDKFYCSKDCDNLGMFVSNKIEPQIDFRFSAVQRLHLSNSAVRACRKCIEGVVVFEDGEVEQLNKRLQILGEDGEVIKQAFFSSVEERKRLIHEIYQLFQIIHHFLCLQSLVTGEKQPHAAALTINAHKVTPLLGSTLLIKMDTYRQENKFLSSLI